MEVVSFEELRKIHLQEKHSPLLSQLEEGFFDIYGNYLDKFYSELKTEFSIESARTFENCRTVFSDLVRLRGQKVILKAFKDVKAGGVSTDGLTHQEKELYTSLLSTFTRYEQGITKKAQAVQPVAIKVKLKLTVDLPEFVSPSGQTLGPFTIGETTEVDASTAGLLLGRNVAEKTD